ncbi:hypothetical protein B566_EDAN011588 [Ephemera danica]|nr:hypothetical protein B566_EDAN011588 [Ephemera danica]
MPIFCFFCARSLREAVRYIALIYVAITLYDLFWAVYHLTLNYTHWIYYVSLVVCLISLPFHGILFMGSQQERRDYVYWWIGFTLVVTFPFLVLWLAICIFEFSIWCIFHSGLTCGSRFVSTTQNWDYNQPRYHKAASQLEYKSLQLKPTGELV